MKSGKREEKATQNGGKGKKRKAEENGRKINGEQNQEHKMSKCVRGDRISISQSREE